MRTALIAAALLLGACTDPTTEPGDPAQFNGAWGVGRSCSSVVGGTCALPSWFAGISLTAEIDNAVVQWAQSGTVETTHVGAAAGPCLSVPAGNDEGLAREAYSLCFNGDDLTGEVVWSPGTQAQCSCDLTLRQRL